MAQRQIAANPRQNRLKKIVLKTFYFWEYFWQKYYGNILKFLQKNTLIYSVCNFSLKNITDQLHLLALTRIVHRDLWTECGKATHRINSERSEQTVWIWHNRLHNKTLIQECAPLWTVQLSNRLDLLSQIESRSGGTFRNGIFTHMWAGDICPAECVN